jgi:hypothetical protein
MRVIVKIKYQEGEIITKFLDLAVRKCPPNYKPKESEWILELDDYSEEDIKEYFPEAEEQFISLMHDEDEGVHEC